MVVAASSLDFANAVVSRSITFSTSADVAGTIVIYEGNELDMDFIGDFSGTLTVTTNYEPLNTGTGIFVGGNLTGTIDVGGILNGLPHVNVDGDLTGDILVGENLEGSMQVDGMFSGRIDVGRHLNGDIVIEQEMTSSGSITINAACALGNANGLAPLAILTS